MTMTRSSTVTALLANESSRCVAPKPTTDSVRVGLPPRTPTGRLRRYSFGHVWCRNVLNRNVTDHDKVIAHGVTLLIGPRSELAQMPFGELLTQVRYKLCFKIREDMQKQREICDMMALAKQVDQDETENEMKMIKATSTTEFTRHELLKTRLADGFPGVTQAMVDSALASANSLLTQEFKTSVEKFQKKHGAADWYKAVRAMYEIVEENHQWRIVSNAKDWTDDHRKEWVANSRWEAEAKINTLMWYRENDLRRGRGDPEKHIERGNRILEGAAQ